MGRLEGRKALVTGGSRGIGRAICLRFAHEGADVGINYNGNEAAARETAAEVEKLGRKAWVYQANVGQVDACNRMAEQAIAHMGQVDILVNNAGIGSSGIGRPTMTEITPEQIDLVMGANLMGPMYLAKALVPHMRAAERSDIIMVSSVAAQNMGPRMGVYSISKAGVEALAHTLAKEEREHGMRVNIVAPGLVETDMGRKLISLLPGPDDMRERDATAPFGYVCQPEDIAAAVAYLCSEDARYITNQRITVNGGGF